MFRQFLHLGFFILCFRFAYGADTACEINQSIVKEINFLRDLVKTLSEEMKFLREKTDRLEIKVENGHNDDNNQTVPQKRLLLPDNPTTQTIAFSAYLTHLDLGPAIGTHREIIFDKIETNIGNSYSPYSGSFRAPKDGVYAFTWTIFAAGTSSSHGEINTELVINGQMHGNLHVDTEVDNDDDTGTGFLIKRLTTGDIVFIRSSSFTPQGTLVNSFMRWAFSGWLIE